MSWDIFAFFSATTKRNSTKLEDPKHPLVKFFSGDQKTKMTTLASDGYDIFARTSFCNRWTQPNET